MYVCVSSSDFASLYDFLFDFGTVPTRGSFCFSFYSDLVWSGYELCQMWFFNKDTVSLISSMFVPRSSVFISQVVNRKDLSIYHDKESVIKRWLMMG